MPSLKDCAILTLVLISLFPVPLGNSPAFAADARDEAFNPAFLVVWADPTKIVDENGRIICEGNKGSYIPGRNLMGEQYIIYNRNRYTTVVLDGLNEESLLVKFQGMTKFVNLKSEYVSFRWLGPRVLRPGEGTRVEWQFHKVQGERRVRKTDLTVAVQGSQNKFNWSYPQKAVTPPKTAHAVIPKSRPRCLVLNFGNNVTSVSYGYGEYSTVSEKNWPVVLPAHVRQAAEARLRKIERANEETRKFRESHPGVGALTTFVELKFHFNPNGQIVIDGVEPEVEGQD